MINNTYNNERISRAGFYLNHHIKEGSFTYLDHYKGLYSGFNIIRDKAIRDYIRKNPNCLDKIRFFNINESPEVFLERYLSFHINEISRFHEVTREFLQNQYKDGEDLLREDLSVHLNEKFITSMTIVKVFSYKIFLLMLDIVDDVENEIETGRIKEFKEIEKNRTLCEKVMIWFKRIISNK